MRTIPKSIFFPWVLGLVLSLNSFFINTQATLFEDGLRITAYPSKHAAYLKKSGEAPSPYE